MYSGNRMSYPEAQDCWRRKNFTSREVWASETQMSHAIKTVKIAPWNCLFLKASGEIFCPKGNSTEWVFGVSWDLRFAFTLFSHSRRQKQGEKIPAFGSEIQKGRRGGKNSQRGQSPAGRGLFSSSLELSWLFWCVKSFNLQNRQEWKKSV